MIVESIRMLYTHTHEKNAIEKHTIQALKASTQTAAVGRVRKQSRIRRIWMCSSRW
jgi:hypothetical protein